MIIDYTGHRSFEALEAAAIQASLDHPGYYVVVGAFGFSSYRLHLSRRLSRTARSLASNSGPLRDGYFLNGKRRRWTTAQVVADQQDWR